VATASPDAPEAPPAATPAAEPERARSWRVALAVAAVVSVVLAVLIWWVAVDGGNSQVRVEIPAGTARLLADGKDPSVVEGEILLDVGDELVVLNRDDRPHVFGSLTIAPGATQRIGYDQAGRFAGPSSVTTDSTVTILVR